MTDAAKALSRFPTMTSPIDLLRAYATANQPCRDRYMRGTAPIGSSPIASKKYTSVSAGTTRKSMRTRYRRRTGGGVEQA